MACAAGSSLAAGRAYVALDQVSEYNGDAPVKERLISLSQTTDLIEENVVEKTTSDVYTLTGIRVLNNATRQQAERTLPAGIYIMNNKKIVIK